MKKYKIEYGIKIATDELHFKYFDIVVALDKSKNEEVKNQINSMYSNLAFQYLITGSVLKNV